MHLDLRRAYPIGNTESAVREFHDTNDSLAKLLESIKIAEILHLSGELTVMRKPLLTTG